MWLDRPVEHELGLLVVRALFSGSGFGIHAGLPQESFAENATAVYVFVV